MVRLIHRKRRVTGYRVVADAVGYAVRGKQARYGMCLCTMDIQITCCVQWSGWHLSSNTPAKVSNSGQREESYTAVVTHNASAIYMSALSFRNDN